MFLADLHVHSNFSDGKLSVPELVDFYGERGFGAIAITDHICETKSFLGLAANFLKCTLDQEKFPHYISTLEQEAQRAYDLYKMVVIPGFELTKNSVSFYKSAHILGLGVRKFIDANDTVENLSAKIRGLGGLSIAAHPVSTRRTEAQTYYLWDRREELASHFDAWEVASGTHFSSEVEDSGLPMLATSDFHHPKHITGWKTVFNCEKSEIAILNAIKKQELQFHFFREVARSPNFVKSPEQHQFVGI